MTHKSILKTTVKSTEFYAQILKFFRLKEFLRVDCDLQNCGSHIDWDFHIQPKATAVADFVSTSHVLLKSTHVILNHQIESLWRNTKRRLLRQNLRSCRSRDLGELFTRLFLPVSDDINIIKTLRRHVHIHLGIHTRIQTRAQELTFLGITKKWTDPRATKSSFVCCIRSLRHSSSSYSSCFWVARSTYKNTANGQSSQFAKNRAWLPGRSEVQPRSWK